MTGYKTPREDLVAHWTLASTKTNIGTSMVDIYTTTNDAGLAVRIDFTDKTQVAAEIQWDKVGAGTQTLECVDVADVTKILFTLTVVSGNNVLALTAIPAHFLAGIKLCKLRASSTTAGDDPVFRGCSVRLK